MANRDRNPAVDAVRRGAALYLGAVNLLGETVRDPRKWARSIERRGERVLGELERNNRTVRRSMTLLRRRAADTVSTAGSSVGATVGIASALTSDARTATAAPRARGSRSTTRKPTARNSNGVTAEHRKRVAAARKAVVTRKANATKLKAKKRATVAKARATRAANASKGSLEKGLERFGQRVEKAVESIAS